MAPNAPGGADIMSIEVREMLNDDALAFLQVHHAAVRGIAAKDYPPEVVEAWAPMPITDQSIERFLTNPDGELRLVAEIDGRIVGIGALVLAKSELRACYVAPQAARRGVGSALMHELERIARDNGLANLQMDSSVTAEPFYLAPGYNVRGRGGTAHGLRQDGEGFENVASGMGGTRAVG
jgi:putative acetyltransferase